MASLAATLTSAAKLRNLLRTANPSAAFLRRSLCSSLDPAADAAPDPPATPDSATASFPASDSAASPASDSAASTDPPPGRPTRRSSDRPLDQTIAHMMAQRPWTTRLQNSIRSLVPHFDQPLVLAVLRSARHPDHALAFFRWVEKTGFRHDRDTYQSIIALLTRNDMLNHARCILIDDMPKRAVPREESMFAALIDGYGHAGIPQEAVKIFRRMPELGVERTALSYDSFFKAILRSGRIMMAKRAFNHMIREGVTPTLSTYNTLLWGFCLSIKMETANRFFVDMKERGLTPDIVSYNTLLNGWVRAKKLEDAQKVFDEMAKAGFEPNLISYNILIKGYVSEGKMDDGMRLFGEMSAKGLQPSDRTYAVLLPGLCDEQERVAEARKLLDEMAERKITPKDKSVFLKMISCLCNSGDLDGALGVRQAMDQFRVAVDSSHYGVLIEGLCKGEKYDRAVEILDELIGKTTTLLGPQTSAIEPTAYNPMIEYLCGNGLTEKAETFFRQLMKKGVDDKIAFNHLIRGHAKEGAPESAFNLLQIMTGRGVASDADAYSLLVDSYLKKGEPADARTVLDSMMEQGHMPSPSLFRSVMVGLFDDGRVQTASRVMRSMIEKGVKENMDIAHKILEALLMRGHVEEALGRINLLMTKDCMPDFDKLLAVLCENDKVMEAYKLADFVLERDCDISFSNYDLVLDALYAADKNLWAYSLLCKIKTKGGVVDKKGCDALIKNLNAQGNTKQADILSRILAGRVQPEMKRGKKVPMNNAC